MRDKDEAALGGNFKRLDLEVFCPFCGAGPGQYCGRDRDPDQRGTSHKERLDYMADKSRGEADLRAAKERLGAWLAAEERRTWELALIQPFGAREQYWYAALFAGTSTSGEQAARCVAEERGPTEAAAIFAALEKANGGA